MANLEGSYLTDNKDFDEFIQQSSNRTGDLRMALWLENVKINKTVFQKSGWASGFLQGVGRGKTVVMIGASPALKNQVEELQSLKYDKDFMFCCTNSNLEFLLKNRIQPDYCIVVDGEESTGEDWANLDMEKTKDVTMLANTFACPECVKKWKGPLYFIALQTESKKLRKKVEKHYGPANGLGTGAGIGIPSLIASYNVMTGLAHIMFESAIIIFVGNELSFNDPFKSRYYVDRDDPRDSHSKYAHGDIYGNKVYTTSSLLAVKYCLEAFLELLQGSAWFFNCTEAGIFGITKRCKNHQVPWISQLTLTNGIAQARQIMRTGQPFYE
jgi:hypothetical protein